MEKKEELVKVKITGTLAKSTEKAYLFDVAYKHPKDGYSLIRLWIPKVLVYSINGSIDNNVVIAKYFALNIESAITNYINPEIDELATQFKYLYNSPIKPQPGEIENPEYIFKSVTYFVKERPKIKLEKVVFVKPKLDPEEIKKIRIESVKKTHEKIKKNTQKKISEYINNWDFKVNGKISQSKLSSVSGVNIKTIEKHYSNFKQYISELNQQYKQNL